MAADLTETERRALQILAARKREPLCPNCGYREQDRRSKNGWCQKCDDDRDRELAKKREWWMRNRGKEQT